MNGVTRIGRLVPRSRPVAHCCAVAEPVAAEQQDATETSRRKEEREVEKSFPSMARSARVDGKPHSASRRTSQGSAVLHEVELDAVDERFARDRAGVGGAIAKRLPIAFTRAADVSVRHGRERQQLDGVDLDDDTGSRVTAADFDLRAAPESDRHGDLAASHSLAKLSTKHHSPTLRRTPSVADDLNCRDQSSGQPRVSAAFRREGPHFKTVRPNQGTSADRPHDARSPGGTWAPLFRVCPAFTGTGASSGDSARLTSS